MSIIVVSSNVVSVIHGRPMCHMCTWSLCSSFHCEQLVNPCLVHVFVLTCG